MSRVPSDDVGAATVELVLLTPVLLVLAVVLVAAGQLPRARLHADAAAHDAARAATVAASRSSAVVAASTAARETLRREHVACASIDVNIDLARFTAGGTVTVTVRCQLDHGWARLPGLRLPTSVVGTATVPVDVYRSEPTP